jgi:hypothetical protein
MAHRKGIIDKRVAREEKRRREAKENGIVLERKGGKERRRGRGKGEGEIDGPGVGKWRGGMLRLSGRDVRDIEGPKERERRKKSGKR